MTTHAPAGFRDQPASTTSSPREVVAAWIVLVVLLVGTGVSFALDHMVTVSDRTDWSSFVTSAGGSTDDDDAETAREVRDSPGR
jgi:hypothetical protein